MRRNVDWNYWRGNWKTCMIWLWRNHRQRPALRVLTKHNRGKVMIWCWGRSTCVAGHALFVIKMCKIWMESKLSSVIGNKCRAETPMIGLPGLDKDSPRFWALWMCPVRMRCSSRVNTASNSCRVIESWVSKLSFWVSRKCSTGRLRSTSRVVGRSALAKEYKVSCFWNRSQGGCKVVQTKIW